METTIRISPEVHAALLQQADEFDGQLVPGELKSDGWYEVPVPPEVAAHLARVHEDPDEAAKQLLGWVPRESSS
jgi:hypothetical protein